MLIPVLLVLMVGMALALIVVGVRMPAKEVTIEERLATFAERPIPLEQLELQRPFSERVRNSTLPRPRQETPASVKRGTVPAAA